MGTIVLTGTAGARAEVVRLTGSPDGADDAGNAGITVTTFGADARPERLLGVPVTGVPSGVTLFEAGPPGSEVAYLGTRTLASPPPDEELDERTRAEAGLLPTRGGVARAFTDPPGGPLGRVTREFASSSNDQPRPSITWAPGGASLVLHEFDPDPRRDPWFGSPRSRRCEITTLRCRAEVAHDVVDLPDGGTVEIRADVRAGTGANRSLSRRDRDGRALARGLRARLARRFSVTVSVAGRPGAAAAWRTAARLRDGAPAFDRAYPGPAGVLVRTSRIRPPRRIRTDESSSVAAGVGPAVIVRRDGTIKRLGRFGSDVVGTLPDGRWILSGGTGARLEPGPPGLPLETLDVDGRRAPLTWGTRPVSPVWVASTVGLKDSIASEAEVLRAGVDTTTGLVVLVPEFTNGPAPGRVIAFPTDGSTPPRLLRDAPGRGSQVDLVR